MDDKTVDALERRIAAMEIRLALVESRVGEGPNDDELAELRQKLREIEIEHARRPSRPSYPSRPRPNPDHVYAVPIDGAAQVGSPNARVTMVKAFEFACPFCDRVRPTIKELQKRYGKDLRIVYKHFVVHPATATLAAQAACAANRQGKFKKMYDKLFDQGFANIRQGGLAEDNLKKMARSIGLRMGKFKLDLKSDYCAHRVRHDQSELQKVGVTGTPAFFINGRFLSGARPVDQFIKLIDEELAKAKKSGIKKDYYDHILRTGKKELE
jgi:protein-disulfide isomerase